MNSVDFYRGFDEQFFEPALRKKWVDAYSKILEEHSHQINASLLNPQVNFENDSVYQTLRVLQKHELTHESGLRKPKEGLRTTMEDLILKVGLSPADCSLDYSKRFQYHLTRLISPEKYIPKNKHHFWLERQPQTQYTTAFARELLQYLGTNTPTKKEEDFMDIVSSEGFHVFLFWTLGPYLHLNLKERGLSAVESAARVVEWVALAPPGELYGDYNLHMTAGVRQHLDRTCFHVLGFDERMPSHLKARLLAREVAAELAK